MWVNKTRDQGAASQVDAGGIGEIGNSATGVEDFAILDQYPIRQCAGTRDSSDYAVVVELLCHRFPAGSLLVIYLIGIGNHAPV